MGSVVSNSSTANVHSCFFVSFLIICPCLLLMNLDNTGVESIHSLLGVKRDGSVYSKPNFSIFRVDILIAQSIA